MIKIWFMLKFLFYLNFCLFFSIILKNTAYYKFFTCLKYKFSPIFYQKPPSQLKIENIFRLFLVHTRIKYILYHCKILKSILGILNIRIAVSEKLHMAGISLEIFVLQILVCYPCHT